MPKLEFFHWSVIDMDYRDYFEFDDTQAVKVFRRLVEAWRKKEGGFGRSTPPEIEYLPDWAMVDEVALAQLLFFWAFLNQGRSKAREVMAKAVPIVSANPWVIDPALFVEMMTKGSTSLDDMANLVGPILPYGPAAKAKQAGRWCNCLEKLTAEYNGDPRQIVLRAEPNLESIQKAIVAFDGFGPKVANLALLWFQGVDWPDHKDEWAAIRQIPVALGDIWVMRLVYMFGILTKILQTDHHKTSGPMIAQYIIEICAKNNIPTSELCQALWHLGADICGKRPKNMNDSKTWSYCLANCPGDPFCSCFVLATNYRETGRIEWGRTSIPRPNTLIHPRDVARILTPNVR